MKTLNIIETAYRATLEEQDDPVIWIIHAMKSAGAEHSVVLRANAVNYAVKAQGAPPLAFGARRQQQGPHLAEAVSGLTAKGVEVYVVSDDLSERGLQGEELIGGLKPVRRIDLPTLCGNYDQVWHW